MPGDMVLGCKSCNECYSQVSVGSENLMSAAKARIVSSLRRYKYVLSSNNSFKYAIEAFLFKGCFFIMSYCNSASPVYCYIAILLLRCSSPCHCLLTSAPARSSIFFAFLAIGRLSFRQDLSPFHYFAFLGWAF